MADEYTYLIALLRCALRGTAAMEKPENLSWKSIYALAAKHGVTVLAYSAVDASALASDAAVFDLWSESCAKIITKRVNQEHELVRLAALFAKEELPYMPLKGSCIKDLYPAMEYRDMTDLDILIPANESARAHALMLREGYSPIATTSHNTEYIKRPYLVVELHTNLVPRECEYFPYYEEPWKRARKTDAPFCHDLSNEDLYIYQLAHTAKHYYGCGTGLRSVMDVYVFLTKHRSALDESYLAREFDKLGLRGFRETIEELAFYWFSQRTGALSDDGAEMAHYIRSSSTYGSQGGRDENYVRRHMRKGKSARAAKFSFYMTIVFPGRKELAYTYAALHKAPILLPFFWVVRGVRVLVSKPRSIVKQYRRTKKIRTYEEIKMDISGKK
ncbi:MAG: nucleotidyltransferase family protein [Oscillospiraceae bacterium]|nr:nucleotidyltransferase family protein [Oscillospiraceae bacterium]